MKVDRTSYEYCSNGGERCKGCSLVPRDKQCKASRNKFGHQCGALPEKEIANEKRCSECGSFASGWNSRCQKHDKTVKLAGTCEDWTSRGKATNETILSIGNQTDAYIIRCLKEGKISVDCENGEIYSHQSQRNFKQFVNWAGYHYLDFKFFGMRASVLVHRIVYLSKYGAIPDGFEIDHIDRDTHNNKISNLRAVSREDNMKNRRGYK